MGIVISTLSGIFLLGEKKSKKQLAFVTIGCALVINGGIIFGEISFLILYKQKSHIYK
ncbi:GRP family sugar transporter [Peribacillus butanolivorans]